jgi:Phage tail lysozyme
VWKGRPFDFGEQALGVMDNLKRDFGLKSYQAAGVLGNLGHESHAFQWLTQLQKGGKEWISASAGRGWAQWSGKRGKDFLRDAFDKGLDWRSPEANYGYLAHELKTKYGRLMEHMRHTANTQQATLLFEKGFERAGKPQMRSRYAFDILTCSTPHAVAATMASQQQKVSGDASLRIDLRGFPKGTHTKTAMSGMFSSIRVARGRAMPLADQG